MCVKYLAFCFEENEMAKRVYLSVQWHDQNYEISARRLYDCGHGKKQTSVMAGTRFHGRHLSLVKWFGLSIFLT